MTPDVIDSIRKRLNIATPEQNARGNELKSAWSAVSDYFAPSPDGVRIRDVVRDAIPGLKSVAQESVKFPVSVAMVPADVASEALTGKALPPLNVPGFGEVKSYGRRQEEDVLAGKNPYISGLQHLSEGILDAAALGGIGEQATKTLGGMQALDNHITSAKQIQENMPSVDTHELIKHTQTNIVDGLKERYPDISAKAASLNPADYKSVDEFAQALKGTQEPTTMLDEGTLNGNLVKNAAKNAKGNPANLADPEFRSIHQQSRVAKKMFGDLDSKTMYGAAPTGPLLLPQGTDEKSNASLPPKELQPMIAKAYEVYPEVPKGLIEAVLMQESSMGTKDTNRASDVGKFGWLGGVTTDGRHGDMLKQKDLFNSSRMGNFPGWEQQDKISGTIGTVASILAQGIQNNNLQIKTPEDALNLYDKYYKTKKGAKLTPEQRQQFKKYYVYYKSLNSGQ